MRYSTAIVGALAFCASEVVAFPAAAIEFAARAEHDASARRDIEAAVAKLQAQRRAPGFNAAEQYVSTHGEYEFVPPNAPNTRNGDQRGPCPGLNAMANHGYLPHNGVATIQQFIDGTYDGKYIIPPIGAAANILKYSEWVKISVVSSASTVLSSMATSRNGPSVAQHPLSQAYSACSAPLLVSRDLTISTRAMLAQLVQICTNSKHYPTTLCNFQNFNADIHTAATPTK